MDNDRLADRRSTVYFPLSTLSAEGRPPPPLCCILLHSGAHAGARKEIAAVAERGKRDNETFCHLVTLSPSHLVTPTPLPPLRDIRGHLGHGRKWIMDNERGLLGALGVSYVQRGQEMFYCRSSCLQDDERSEESCEHDDRPTTDCVSVFNDRRQAWFKPATCRFARTDV